MGYFFFDESIHKRGDFILGAFVYSEHDPCGEINKALLDLGLVPGKHEFKSRSLMNNDACSRELRDKLKRLLQQTKIGLVILPYGDRQFLGKEAFLGLKKILSANSLVNEAHSVYFDSGISIMGTSTSIFPPDCRVHLNQDSRNVPGLQLADLAAHCLSIMLLEALGVIHKKVKAGPGSGYDPELDIEIGFEMWATLRYCFFKEEGPTVEDLERDPIESMMLEVGSYGLHVSSRCSETLRIASEARFAKCYMGCIH